MTYTEFLNKLSEAALAHANGDSVLEVDLTPVNENAGISGDATKEITFDGSGNWSYALSQFCPFNVDVTAVVQSAPEGSVFSVDIDTNCSEHKHYDNIHPNQEIRTTIKTKMFAETSISIKVNSNKPNTKATFKIHYRV